MESPAYILRQLCLDLGLAAAGELFVGSMPETPGAAATMAFYDTAGRLDGRNMADGGSIYHPAVHIRIRAGSARECWARMDALLTAFDGVQNRRVTIDGVDWIVLAVSRRSGVFSIGPEPDDPVRRQNYTATVTLSLRPG